MIYGTENKVRSYVRRAVYFERGRGRGAIVLPEGDTLKGVTVVRDAFDADRQRGACARRCAVPSRRAAASGGVYE